MHRDTLNAALTRWASKGWEIEQVDYTNAFLNGRLDEPEYAYGVGEDEGKIWEITGNLYGLKQAPLVWNRMLNEILIWVRSHEQG